MDVSLPVKWQEDGQAVCHVVFEFNNEEIVEHCPVETWHSGKHILSLYYPIEKIVANYTNTFNVYLWMENGSGTVDVGDCIASVSGQAMAAGEAWDGKLEVEDYTRRFAIGGGLDVNGFRQCWKKRQTIFTSRGRTCLWLMLPTMLIPAPMSRILPGMRRWYGSGSPKRIIPLRREAGHCPRRSCRKWAQGQRTVPIRSGM